MILHVILASALSASSAASADSVRTPPKTGVVRPDSVLLTLPAPSIKSPTQPEPRIASPVTLAWPSKKNDVRPAEPIKEIAQTAQTARPAAETPKPTPKLVVGTTNQVVIGTTSHITVQSSKGEVSQPVPVADAPKADADSAAKVAPIARIAEAPDKPRPAEVVQQAAVVKPVPLSVAVVAPADASAVAHPLRSAAPTAPAAPAKPITTADGRVVLGTRSTVVVEPLHAVPLPAAGLRLAPPTLADSIVVYKREHTLTLFLRGVPVRSYFVALGSRPIGDKVSAGDDRTPEGLFTINAHNPASKYHLALRISYPDDAHRARAAKLGVDPGGDIMIHGLPIKFKDAGKDHRLDDWTNGCVALTNEEIEEIWHAVPDGTPIQIKP